MRRRAGVKQHEDKINEDTHDYRLKHLTWNVVYLKKGQISLSHNV
jgi:hypothetical protein